jgi:hypothetical protein
MTSPLWRTRLRERLVPCGDQHGFHKSNPLCTGVFELPVGDVGNRGSTTGRRYRISNSPELHRQVLENPAPAQVVKTEPIGKDFHFSLYNYGDYYLFLLSNYSFLTPPSHCTAGCVERAAAPHKTATAIFKRIQRPFTESSLQNLRYAPLPGPTQAQITSSALEFRNISRFSTHTGKQKVNTIKAEEETDPSAEAASVVE